MNEFTKYIPIIILLIFVCIISIILIIKKSKHIKHKSKDKTAKVQEDNELSKYLPKYSANPITEPSIEWPVFDKTKIKSECSNIIRSNDLTKSKKKPLLDEKTYTFIVPGLPVIQSEETLQKYLKELTELKNLVSSVHDKTLTEKQEIDKERDNLIKSCGPILDAEAHADGMINEKKAEYENHEESLKKDIIDYKSKIDKTYEELENYKTELQRTCEKLNIDKEAAYKIMNGLKEHKDERVKDANIVRERMKDIEENDKDYSQALNKQKKVLSNIEDKILVAMTQLDKIKAIKEVEIQNKVVENEQVITDEPETVSEEIISTTEKKEPVKPKDEKEIMDEIRAGWKKDNEEKEKTEEHRRKFKEEQKIKQQEAEKKKKAMREEFYKETYK